MRPHTSQPRPRITALPLLIVLALLAGGLYWVLTRVVFPPYQVVDLSGVVDVDERVRANHNGDLVFAKDNAPTVLSNGRLMSWAPPHQMDAQTVEVEAVNDSDRILCVVWRSVHSGNHPPLICVVRNGKWQQLETPGRAGDDSTGDPAVDINDAGDVAGSYTLERGQRGARILSVVSVLWRTNGKATLFGVDPRWPKCVIMPSPNEKMIDQYWRDVETLGVSQGTPTELAANGTLYCVDADMDPTGDEMIRGIVRVLSRYMTIFPDGKYQITATPRSPASIFPVTVMRSPTDSLNLDGRMLDIDLLRHMPSNEMCAGTVVVANSQPVTLQELGTAAGWRRLFRGPGPILSARQSAQHTPPTLTDVGDTYQAVTTHGKSLAFLNDLISPMSHWQLVTATHVDKDGRILCIGKHNGKLHWCVLVPRGRTFRLPQQQPDHQGVGA